MNDWAAEPGPACSGGRIQARNSATRTPLVQSKMKDRTEVQVIAQSMLLLTFLPQPSQSTTQPTIVPVQCEMQLPGESAEMSLEICKADQAVYQASQLGAAESERRQLFEAAVRHYNRALDLASGTDARMMILRGLLNVLQPSNHPDPYGREEAAHQLISLDPGNIDLHYLLAEAQEAQGRYDAAELTLLQARKASPTLESFSRLTRFYAQAAARVNRNQGSTTGEPTLLLADAMDADRLATPPRRLEASSPVTSPTPAGAPTTEVEILIDETGSVSQARVARSIDRAILQHVRYWRFEPTIINGRPVKVRMITTVDVPSR